MPPRQRSASRQALDVVAIAVAASQAAIEAAVSANSTNNTTSGSGSGSGSASPSPSPPPPPSPSPSTPTVETSTALEKKKKNRPTPSRSQKRAQSAQADQSCTGSPWTPDTPATTPTPSSARKSRKKKGCTPAAAAESPTFSQAPTALTSAARRTLFDSSDSSANSFIDPSILAMPSMQQQDNISASALMPPPPIPSPTKENIPMATPSAGGCTMDPMTPIPQSKRRRVDEMEAATPDATQQQQAYAHGLSALNSALLQIQTPNPATGSHQKPSLNGGDYPGSRIHTLRLITYDMHIVSYTKNIIIQQPFANGQRPSLIYVRQQLQRRWETKYEGYPHCFDYIDLGLLNTMESYKRMALRAATALNGGGIVEKGGPVKMMQIFGMEFIMEIGSEEEWDCFWDEILAGWQAEPEGGVLNVSLGFWTVKNKASDY